STAPTRSNISAAPPRMAVAPASLQRRRALLAGKNLWSGEHSDPHQLLASASAYSQTEGGGTPRKRSLSQASAWPTRSAPCLRGSTYLRRTARSGRWQVPPQQRPRASSRAHRLRRARRYKAKHARLAVPHTAKWFEALASGDRARRGPSRG